MIATLTIESTHVQVDENEVVYYCQIRSMFKSTLRRMLHFEIWRLEDCHGWVISIWINCDTRWIRTIDLLFLMTFALLLGVKPWSNIMEILEEKDGVDTELLVYAMTLVNKVG